MQVSNLCRDKGEIPRHPRTLSKVLDIPDVMMTYILAYHESNPRPRGLCAKPLTIVITYRICDYNNYIFSEYKIFGIF